MGQRSKRRRQTPKKATTSSKHRSRIRSGRLDDRREQLCGQRARRWGLGYIDSKVKHRLFILSLAREREKESARFVLLHCPRAKHTFVGCPFVAVVFVLCSSVFFPPSALLMRRISIVFAGKKNRGIDSSGCQDGQEVTELSSECLSDLNSDQQTSVSGQIPSSRLSRHHLAAPTMSTASGENLLLRTAGSVSGGLQRNGNELRRSLRRINSITRRKLSPNVASSTSASSKLSGIRRKHSHSSADHLDECAIPLQGAPV